jgi:hypothetical protein
VQIQTLCLSPDGTLLFIINEEGQAQLIIDWMYVAAHLACAAGREAAFAPCRRNAQLQFCSVKGTQVNGKAGQAGQRPGCQVQS